MILVHIFNRHQPIGVVVIERRICKALIIIREVTEGATIILYFSYSLSPPFFIFSLCLSFVLSLSSAPIISFLPISLSLSFPFPCDR